uniref:Uncharacterized protein n=1 Tax=Naegleria fowleri TaxID=5763 RepID=M1H0R2_NAEFO|nr:hypothetical protein [Naegleria fowleri]
MKSTPFVVGSTKDLGDEAHQEFCYIVRFVSDYELMRFEKPFLSLLLLLYLHLLNTSGNHKVRKRVLYFIQNFIHRAVVVAQARGKDAAHHIGQAKHLDHTYYRSHEMMLVLLVPWPFIASDRRRKEFIHNACL